MTEQEYDILYDEIMEFLKEVNPCKVKNKKCFRNQQGGRNFCCGSVNSQGKGECKHCLSSGCTAEKPMACRLWLCPEAYGNLTVAERYKLNRLRERAGIFGNEDVMFRTTKKEAFDIVKKLTIAKEYYAVKH